MQKSGKITSLDIKKARLYSYAPHYFSLINAFEFKPL